MNSSLSASKVDGDKIVGRHRAVDAAVPATMDTIDCNIDEVRTNSVRRSTEIIRAPIARWLGLTAFTVVSLAIIAGAIWLTRS
jgi:hypothetical protein